MITKHQRYNAERIDQLARRFGRLELNYHGQTVESVLNLTIPCAHLVIAGVVTGVDPETNDGLTDTAVDELERYCVRAIEHALEGDRTPWTLAYQLVQRADEVGLELPQSLSYIALECRSGRGKVAA